MRIGMVHQHFMLIPVMTVAENVVLASEPRKGALLDRDAAEQRVRELSERFGLRVDPRAYVEDIGVGQQQRVEILRVLHRGADVLILDEPTAVLTAQETAELFKVLRALTAEGVSVDLHLAQAARGARDRRPRHGAAARQEDRHGPDRGRDRGEPRQADGRPRRAVPRREGRGGGRASRCSRSRTSRSRTTAGCRPCAGSRCRCAPARSSASPASTATASPSWSRRSPACAPRTAATSASRGKDITGARRAAARSRRASATSPRTATGAGSILDFTLAENLALREYQRAAAEPARACSRRKRMEQQARPLLEQYDVRGGRPETTGRLAVGRQPAEGRDRARARRGAAGHDRRAADARARRRRDRVRAQAAARAARRRAAACCSSRSSSRRSARWRTACS